MSGRLARSTEASAMRLLVLDGDTPLEVFDVLGIAGDIIRVRSALLFEVGEELTVRIEQDGSSWDATARVRGHTGDDAPISELEITDRSEPHRVVGD